MGGPRLLVERPLYETVLTILGEAVSGVPVGDPFDPKTVVGPMAADKHVAKVEEYVQIARDENARIVTGGERLDLDGGFYYKPTVIADLDNASRVVQEEIFGPVLTVQPFDTEDEAIALANGTEYGLAAGLQTGNVARAHRVAAKLQAGIVWVNDWAMLDPAVPFGGVKNSGFGREYGPEASSPTPRSSPSSFPSTDHSPLPGAPMTSTIAAVVETGGAEFTLSPVELDELQPHEIRVRMSAAGLCHTDLGVAPGHCPFPCPVCSATKRRRRRRSRGERRFGVGRRPRPVVLHLVRCLRELP